MKRELLNISNALHQIVHDQRYKVESHMELVRRYGSMQQALLTMSTELAVLAKRAND